MRGPYRSVSVRANGKMIDEDWRGALELHIVGRCIRKLESTLKRGKMKIEMQKRRLAVQSEAPLVGIGNEWDLRALENMRGARHRVERRNLDLFDREKVAALGQVFE